MKSLHFIFICTITVALYFFSQTTGSCASSTFYPGRRTLRLRQVPISSSSHKIQAIDDKIKRKTVQGHAMKVKYATSTNDFDEIVYQIDYHGVTTHPTPTPRHERHPKP